MPILKPACMSLLSKTIYTKLIKLINDILKTGLPIWWWIARGCRTALRRYQDRRTKEKGFNRSNDPRDEEQLYCGGSQHETEPKRPYGPSAL